MSDYKKIKYLEDRIKLLKDIEGAEDEYNSNLMELVIETTTVKTYLNRIEKKFNRLSKNIEKLTEQINLIHKDLWYQNNKDEIEKNKGRYKA